MIFKIYIYKGYIGLTDFGIAKIYQRENSSETSGTPGYMAPEVMCAQNHTIAVDYFALGVIGYEFMMGKVNIIYYINLNYKFRDHMSENHVRK
jgi:serine/threonine protein kinase